jgi:hypothetical protein
VPCLGHVGHRDHGAGDRAVGVAQLLAVTADVPRRRAGRRDPDDGARHPAVDQGAVERHLLRPQPHAVVGVVQVEVLRPAARVDRGVVVEAVEPTGGGVEQRQVPVGVAGHDAGVDGLQDRGEQLQPYRFRAGRTRRVRLLDPPLVRHHPR